MRKYQGHEMACIDVMSGIFRLHFFWNPAEVSSYSCCSRFLASQRLDAAELGIRNDLRRASKTWSLGRKDQWSARWTRWRCQSSVKLRRPWRVDNLWWPFWLQKKKKTRKPQGQTGVKSHSRSRREGRRIQKEQNHLLVEFDVGENGVNAPRFGKHGSKGERESGHQRPNTCRADVRKRRFAGQTRVQAQQNDARVRQQASDDDHIVQVRTRHFDVSADEPQKQNNAEIKKSQAKGEKNGKKRLPPGQEMKVDKKR